MKRYIAALFLVIISLNVSMLWAENYPATQPRTTDIVAAFEQSGVVLNYVGPTSVDMNEFYNFKLSLVNGSGHTVIYNGFGRKTVFKYMLKSMAGEVVLSSPAFLTDGEDVIAAGKRRDESIQMATRSLKPGDYTITVIFEYNGVPLSGSKLQLSDIPVKIVDGKRNVTEYSK